jgi:plasmid replication initiation protein
MCIGKVDSKKSFSALKRFEVTAKEFAQKFEISEDKAYQTLKEISEQLFERYVIIDNPDPNDRSLKYTKTRWISAINYHSDAGKVSLQFAPLLIPYLSNLTGNFTFYHLENIGGMNSIYAIRLYELLMQWKITGKREIEIDWLKKQFEIEDGYERMFDFKKYVIDPAVTDINTHSNYQVTWTQRKTGRQVTHLIFEFNEKQPLIPEKPKRVTKPKEKMYFGVPKSEIEKLARIGESYEDAAARINKSKEAAKKSATEEKAKSKVSKTDAAQHINQLKKALKN